MKAAIANVLIKKKYLKVLAESIKYETLSVNALARMLKKVLTWIVWVSKKTASQTVNSKQMHELHQHWQKRHCSIRSVCDTKISDRPDEF